MISVTSITKKLVELLESSRLRHSPKGQIIYYEGDIPNEAIFIKSGVVKLYNIDEQGNEKILHLLGPNSLIPLRFYSGGGIPLKWFYSSLIDCDLYVIPNESLRELMFQDSETSVYLMNRFSDEVHELLVRLDSLNKTNARDKLIAALKFLLVCHSVPRRSGWCRVSFPVSHQLLADMIGMTRESTAVAMKDLATEKIVRNPRQTILEIYPSKLID